MIKINSPISVLEFGSTNIRLLVYDKLGLSQNLFYENKIKYSKNENFFNTDLLTNLIIKVEKDIDQHLNEILLTIDVVIIYLNKKVIKKCDNVNMKRAS